MRLLLLCVVGVLLEHAVHGAYINSIEPRHGSLGGGTVLTITGNDLMGNDTNGVDIYTGQLPCKVLWYASNNEKVYCKTYPLHWWGSGSPGYKVMYSNWIQASLTSCADCHFEFGDEWTPRVKRTDTVVSSRSILGFGGVLRGKFARQYEVLLGDYGRCEGMKRRGAPQLAFGLDYEQQIAEQWDEDVDVTCYLPELEAGRYNYSVEVNHLAPGVIAGEDDPGTKLFRTSEHGLGAARFNEGLVRAEIGNAHTLLVVPQLESFSTQVSGSHGQHTLVITGSGFSAGDGCASNTVVISGVECPITSCTPAEIQCTVQAAPNPATPAANPPHAGSFGLARTTKAGGIVVSKDTYHNHLAGDFALQNEAYGSNAQTLDGYFVAPYTAYYTFMAKGNGGCSLKLGTDHTHASLVELARCKDKHTADYIGKAGLMADEPVHLEAGQRYKFQHWQGLGDAANSHFRAAVRIHAGAVESTAPFTKTEQERQYHSWDEVQTLTFAANYQKEIDQVTVSQIVAGSSFKLKKQVDVSYKVKEWNEERQMQVEVKKKRKEWRWSAPIDLDGENPGAALQTLMRSGWIPNMLCFGSTIVTSEGSAVAGKIVFTVTSDCLPRSDRGGWHRYQLQRWQGLIDGASLKPTPGKDAEGNAIKPALAFEVKQHPSTQMAGSFRLSFDGVDYTAAIPVGGADAEVKKAIELGLPQVRMVSVSHVGRRNQWSMAYTFRFNNQGKNLPQLVVDQTNVRDHKVKVTTATLTSGGNNDLFYDPIPAHLFEIATETPNAVVRVNGVTAECSTNRNFANQVDEDYQQGYSRSSDAFGIDAYETPDCSFVYSTDMTPVIEEVAISRGGDSKSELVAGDTVTITGQRFAHGGGDVRVRIGAGDCKVAVHTNTRIECVVGHLKSGEYHPTVIVSTVGRATVADDVKRVKYQLQIESLAGIAGSVRGGGKLVINGTGFSNIGLENEVRIGGGICPVVESSFEHIICVVPFAHELDSIDQTMGGSAGIASSADIAVRVFHYAGGNVFEGGWRERAECLASVVDSAWTAWSTELEAQLRDTKYYGYSCKKCKKQVVLEQERWGSMVGDTYVRDTSKSGHTDGAYQQYQDSGDYAAFTGLLAAKSPYNDAELKVDDDCASDLAALKELSREGAWSKLNQGQGVWSEWATAADTFDYDWELTPIITDISPKQFSSAMTNKITLTGDFAGFTSESQGCKASVRFVSPSGLYRECQQMELSPTKVTCLMIRGKSFPEPEQKHMFPRLKLCTGEGAAAVAHPEPDCCSAAPAAGRIDMALRVDSTFPKQGSLAGGTLVTINGAGFSNEDDKIVRSALTYQYYDRMTVVNITTDHKTLKCDVVSSNFSTVVCKTPMLMAEEADVHELQYHGHYIYTGPRGRNGRIAVSVNDIAATGCGEDKDAWTQPLQDPEGEAALAIPTAEQIKGACEAISTDGGAEVVDYTYTYSKTSSNLAAGFVFGVQARRDVHVTLSPTDMPTSKSLTEHAPMYEIIIGGWGNTQSAIRKEKFGPNVVTEGTPFALSGYTPRTFWVRLSKTGKLDVGSGCQIGSNVMMSYTDPSPIAVSHVGFATVDTEGYFLHCESANGMKLNGRCQDKIAPTRATTAAPTTTTPLYELSYKDTTQPDFVCEFDFNEEATPVFSSLEPTSGKGSTKITIKGANIDQEPTVHIGPHECPVSEYTAVKANVYQVVCDAPAMTAGWYHVRMDVPGKGYAAHPDDSRYIHAFESVLEIDSIAPKQGSWAGGVTVTIAGAGFSSLLRNNTVQIEAGGSTRLAHVLHSTHTELVVVMPTFESEEDDGSWSVDFNGTKTPTKDLSMEAEIMVAVKADLEQLAAFGQTKPIAHRFSAATIDPVGVLNSEMDGFFDREAATYNANTSTWVEARLHVGGTRDCANRADCVFTFMDELTPTITSIAPATGAEGTPVVLSGANLNLLKDSTDGDGTVFEVMIGNQPCAVKASTVTDTAVECIVGPTPAGKHVPYFTNGAVGTARTASTLHFESSLTVMGISSSGGSHGGGHRVTITGSGFGGGGAVDDDGGDRQRRDGAWGGWIIYEYMAGEKVGSELGAAVQLCDKNCEIVSAKYDEIQCITPAVDTLESLQLTDMKEASVLAGVVTSSDVEGAAVKNAAFDRRFETIFESEAADCFTGIDLGVGETAAITKLRWFPAHQRRALMEDGVIEASFDGTDGSWDTLHTIVTSSEGWNFQDLAPSAVYRYIRYRGAAGSKCTTAQLEFSGIAVSPTPVCAVTIGTQLPLSHPSRGPSTTDFSVSAKYQTETTYTYSVDKTPRVSSIAPEFGSSLGGTTLTISGQGLPTNAENAEIMINGRPCVATAAESDGSAVECETSPRTEFKPLSVEISDTSADAGTGRAVHNQTTSYRYLDRWSQQNTWLNDEPPIEGDTVIVPSDQAILVDIPLPELFLVLIQGFLMFDPTAKEDLNMDATYILVYGGTFRAGTEDKPFEGNLNITLHGDRYKTIFIPSFGAKVLAVADRGGLARSSFANGAGHEVPLSQKGILDIHGKPRISTWVHTAETVLAGQSTIPVATPVDFAPGETIVITGHVQKFTGDAVSNDLMAKLEPPCMYPPPSKMTTEERVVVEVRDNGMTVVVSEAFKYDHTSEVITTPNGTTVDLRAQVALLTRNIKIQGDESSPDQLFGSHTIAVHGGHFRVENAEVRNCGQARILGRYCLHYHKTGYNPAPNSYLQSNSIHHSFQRATTIHGTQHALVKNNVAYRVMGHNYFVEDGDEEYVTLEGNLGIETMITPYSLKSDCQASTFWTATPKNIWRNNVAANSHGNGFWFELDAGAAGDKTKEDTIEVSGNIYHDGNLRGWFIAPKYEPKTPQYFHNNTYARNHMDGVFYGRGGDTHHIGDKFVSNSGNGDILWWFFPSRESSRWIPNLKDVTMIGGKWDSVGRQGARKLPPPTAALFAPNMEFFLVDGVEFVDYGDVSTITQCFDCCGYRARQAAYTTRFNRLSFHGSHRRTSYVCPAKQIFFDLDGSLSDEAPGTSVVAYHAHNEWDECPRDDTRKKFSGGLVCNNTVRVRKMQIPLTDGAPLKYAPVVNAGRRIAVKQSVKVDPIGFTAVFETPAEHRHQGTVPKYETKYLLKAIARFLGLNERHVAESPMPEGVASPGVAIIVGGHVDEVSATDPKGRKRVHVSREALCETGTIAFGAPVETGGDGEPATANSFANITEYWHPKSAVIYKPVYCSVASVLEPVCMSEVAIENATAAATTFHATSATNATAVGFGAGTVCLQESEVDRQPADGFPRLLFSSNAECKTWSYESTVFDPNDYKTWARPNPDGTPSRGRSRRQTAGITAAAAEEGVAHKGTCDTWVCADGSGSCTEQVCYSATEAGSGWRTWMKGIDTERDDSCLTWECHSLIAGSDEACALGNNDAEYRCIQSSESKTCTEYHPKFEGSTVEDCARECDSKDGCTSFYRNADGGSTLLSGGNNDKAGNLGACVGECDSDSQCAAGLKCFQRSHGEAIPGCTGVGNGLDWDYCYDPSGSSAATCILYDTPEWAIQASTEMPGTSTQTSANGTSTKTAAPSNGECFKLVPATAAAEEDDVAAAATCSKDMERPHSENTCRPLVPKVDAMGGVNWQQKGSTGELWNNRNGLDEIYYGPGKNNGNSFDWFGWTVPLVTHHDYIMDWDWHDDFEQFSLNWAVPFILQNPKVTPNTFVPPDARFSGPEDFLPLDDESALVSFAYDDFRYRYAVNTQEEHDVPWIDTHSDDCDGSDCTRRDVNATLRTRGDITRFDAFGTGMMDRQDESLRTMGAGGEWIVALNPFYGATTCDAKGNAVTNPTNFKFTVDARQCPPGVCQFGSWKDLGTKMMWSDLETWQELAFADKLDDTMSSTAELPVEWDRVEIPAGFHIVMDVNPPKLGKIVVAGKLSLDDSVDRTLDFETLTNFGIFEIGTEEKPFAKAATITIHGNRSSTTNVVSDQQHLGNKNIANFGTIDWNGKAPAVVHGKLAQTALPGDTTLHMMQAVDWHSGDHIVLTGTDYLDHTFSTKTGSYTGSRFVVLPAPNELTTSSEDLVVANMSADGREVRLTTALKNRHFSGDIDVGFDKDAIRLESSNGESIVAAAVAIAYGPPEVVVAVDGAQQAPSMGKGRGWDYLKGLPMEYPPSSACEQSAGAVVSWADVLAEERRIAVTRLTNKCTVYDMVHNLKRQGYRGVVVVDPDSLYGASAAIPEVGTGIPTLVLPEEVSESIMKWMRQKDAVVSLRGNPVELRASVGNMKRSIVVQGAMEEACTQEQHAANLESYAGNCKERNLEHHECVGMGFIPHDCYFLKGYGASMLTGEVQYGSNDEYDEAIAAGEAPPQEAKIGQIAARGVEFVNFGKLSMKQRGFAINYFSELDAENVTNVLDRCVFRNNWQDGIVVGRAAGVELTDNIVHRTLGVGINVGDRFLNWVEEGTRRDRRSMDVSNEIPWGHSHTVDGNLVSESFRYPFEETESIKTHHWHSGMALRHAMSSFKNNVVSGAYHAGFSFQLQDTPDAPVANHTNSGNEAYGNKYGAVAQNQKRMPLELFRFKSWKNSRAGIVSFDETDDVQLREVVLADNKFGIAYSFRASADLRVASSTIVGITDATDMATTCPEYRVGLVVPRFTYKPRCDGPFGVCKDCSIEGNKMDMRFGNTPTGRGENWYVMNTKFAHFGTGPCPQSSRGIALNPDEKDYTPDTWLSGITWHPTVDRKQRIVLGAVDHAPAECGSAADKGVATEYSSCDAVNYMKMHDQDGTTIGDFWNDGSADNNRGTVAFSDRNPDVTVTDRCRADQDTQSIICRNYAPVEVEINVPPPCNECKIPKFVTVHKYGASGFNNYGEQEGTDLEDDRRSFWTMGAFEEKCSCSDHMMGGSFLMETGLVYDIDLPVENDLNSAGEFSPEWIPPNTELIVHSSNPSDCALVRMHMREAKPVVLFLNGESVEHAKIAEKGTLPSLNMARGSHTLDPQAQRFYVTICGGAGGFGRNRRSPITTNKERAAGYSTYVLRVREAVQVTVEIEMSFAEFFNEIPDLEASDPNSVSLQQRTTGLDRMVNNFGELLTIPKDRIKVVCVHNVGEPCIPEELSRLLGGFNPTGGRARSRRAAATRSAGSEALQIQMDFEPPHPLEASGDPDAYDENLRELEAVASRLANLTNDADFPARFAAMTGLPQISGLAIAREFGAGASGAEAEIMMGSVFMGGESPDEEAESGMSAGGVVGILFLGILIGAAVKLVLDRRQQRLLGSLQKDSSNTEEMEVVELQQVAVVPTPKPTPTPRPRPRPRPAAASALNEDEDEDQDEEPLPDLDDDEDEPLPELEDTEEEKEEKRLAQEKVERLKAQVEALNAKKAERAAAKVAAQKAKEAEAAVVKAAEAAAAKAAKVAEEAAAKAAKDAEEVAARAAQEAEAAAAKAANEAEEVAAQAQKEAEEKARVDVLSMQLKTLEGKKAAKEAAKEAARHAKAAAEVLAAQKAKAEEEAAARKAKAEAAAAARKAAAKAEATARKVAAEAEAAARKAAADAVWEKQVEEANTRAAKEAEEKAKVEALQAQLQELERKKQAQVAAKKVKQAAAMTAAKKAAADAQMAAADAAWAKEIEDAAVAAASAAAAQAVAKEQQPKGFGSRIGRSLRRSMKGASFRRTSARTPAAAAPAPAPAVVVNPQWVEPAPSAFVPAEEPQYDPTQIDLMVDTLFRLMHAKVDSEGCLTGKQLVVVTKKCNPAVPEKTLRQIWSACDAKKRGKLSKNECVKMLAFIGQVQHGMTPNPNDYYDAPAPGIDGLPIPEAAPQLLAYVGRRLDGYGSQNESML